MPDPPRQTATPSATKPLAPRLAFIDGIRALAALFVVLGHTWYEPTNGYYPGKLFNHLGLSYGPIAVAVFIVVSGFCLTLPLAKRDGDLGSIPEFFRRRARRILPPYYAALTLSCLFILTMAHTPTGTVWDICLPLNASAVWRHVLLVHNVVPPLDREALNYPLWSIAVEFQIYLLFPLIAFLLRTVRPKVTVLILTGIGLMISLLLRNTFSESHIWYLGCFGFGAASAWLAVKGEVGSNWNLWGITIGAGSLAVLLTAGKARYGLYQPGFDLAIGAAVALLMGVLYRDTLSENLRKIGLNRLLSWRPLEQIGIFSYSLYLIHAPLLHLHYLILNRLLHPKPEVMFLLLVATLPLIVAESYLFFLIFESPFLHVKNKQR